MARKAHVRFRDELAGYLTETDSGYSFIYDKSYLANNKAKPVSLTLPLADYPWISSIIFGWYYLAS